MKALLFLLFYRHVVVINYKRYRRQTFCLLAVKVLFLVLVKLIYPVTFFLTLCYINLGRNEPEWAAPMSFPFLSAFKSQSPRSELYKFRPPYSVHFKYNTPLTTRPFSGPVEHIQLGLFFRYPTAATLHSHLPPFIIAWTRTMHVNTWIWDTSAGGGNWTWRPMLIYWQTVAEIHTHIAGCSAHSLEIRTPHSMKQRRETGKQGSPLAYYVA